ncbi:ATPase SWSAP1 [Chroicocephalus ridibundus]|uniref:ATPase SWSAP1 n=1 Tax=Chroicocephalus ridibundus TaxID=1192867 RepID=UPI002FDEE07D
MAAALERALGSVTAGEAGAAPVPVLVLGPAGSGRTSLLLRAALAGGGDGPRALFLAPSALPRLPGGDDGGGNDPRALQRLELRYPPSRAALGRELAAVGARPRPPGLLLLDGLERYLEGAPAASARLAALLLEAARAPGSPRPPAQVLAALRLPPPGPQVLPVLRRYFPAECRLRPQPGVHPCLRARLVRPGAPPRRWSLHFGPRGRLRVGPAEGDSEGDEDAQPDGDSEGYEDTQPDGDEAWG